MGLEGAEPAWTDPAWLAFLLGLEERARRVEALCAEHGRPVPGVAAAPPDLVYATLGALRVAETLGRLVPRRARPAPPGDGAPPEELLR